MTAAGDRRPDGWPDPNTRPCDHCGHVWFAGERRHAYVEHDADRAAAEVPVLCVLCLRRWRLGRR
jgi:hypothetical protein